MCPLANWPRLIGQFLPQPVDGSCPMISGHYPPDPSLRSNYGQARDTTNIPSCTWLIKQHHSLACKCHWSVWLVIILMWWHATRLTSCFNRLSKHSTHYPWRGNPARRTYTTFSSVTTVATTSWQALGRIEQILFIVRPFWPPETDHQISLDRMINNSTKNWKIFISDSIDLIIWSTTYASWYHGLRLLGHYWLQSTLFKSCHQDKS